jgi:type VI secretion system protein ImpJ
LQVQDRFLEDTLTFRLQALRFCPWGFRELTLNQAALADGQLMVSSASGIFPHGLLFDVPEADHPPPSKALAELFDPGVKSLDMYLTVPDYRQRGVNVSPGSDGGSRYIAQDIVLRDENTGANDKPVRVARKNLHLLAESENREGCSALRIAQVERTDAGSFRLNPRFIPPLIEVRGVWSVGLRRRCGWPPLP